MTIAEAFNRYRYTGGNRAPGAEIRGIVETDANADVEASKIELGGLRQAKENLQEAPAQRSTCNSIAGTSMTFKRSARHEAIEGGLFAGTEYRSAYFKKLLGRSLSTFKEAACTRAMSEQRANVFARVKPACRAKTTYARYAARLYCFVTPGKACAEGGGLLWRGSTGRAIQTRNAAISIQGYSVSCLPIRNSK